MSEMPNPVTGHCLCGNLSYSVQDVEPMTVALCHCEDCRRQSGAPFSVNVAVDRDALVLEGASKTYVTVGDDSGETRERIFCPECGSPILSILAEAPDIAFLKAGTLDDASWLEPEMEVFTDSAHPWVHDPASPERGLFPRSLPS